MAYQPELDTLEFKIEAALKLYLVASGFAEDTIFTGETTELKVVPAIVCKCHGGPELPAGSNAFLEDVSVCVCSNVDQTNSDADPFPPHRRLVRKLEWVLWGSLLDINGNEHLHTVLSTMVPYLTVMPQIEREATEITIHGRQMETTLPFKMHCYQANNVPPNVAT